MYWAPSPGDKYFLLDKNVNKGFSTEFDSVRPCKNTHKTPPESSLGKASFSGKFQNDRHLTSNLYKSLINRYHLRTKHQTATYNIFFRTILLRDSICLNLRFLRGQTEVILKVKLGFKMWIIYIFF